jgi:hypothetical protein
VSGCFAVDFSPTPEKISYILDACAAHRPWFNDNTWADKDLRRAAANAHLADCLVNGKIWEVWRGADLVGLGILNEVTPKVDAQCHFLFFDHTLADKRELCINLMRWSFERLELHRLSVEIPTYARALAKFVRKLGFRYEAEGRQPYQHKDERLEPLGLAKAYIGSRRYQATLYEGRWHDVLQLSLLREEFFKLHGQEQDQSRRPVENGADTGAAPTEHRLSAGVHEQPPAIHAEFRAADQQSSAADREPLG